MDHNSLANEPSIKRHLDLMFGGAGRNRAIAFTLPSKFSMTITVNSANELYRISQREDCYVGVYLLDPNNIPKKGRGKAENVAAMVGLWLDLDVHPGAFSSKQEAIGWVMKVAPVPPSWVVDSGHGVQPFWRFEEPLSPVGRASALAKAWVEKFSGIAKRGLLVPANRPVIIDPCKDALRVLRLAGTVNHKHGGTVPVTMLTSPGADETAYTVGNLEEWCVTPRGPKPGLESPEKGTSDDPGMDEGEPNPQLSLDMDEEKLSALMANDEKFRRNWRGLGKFTSESECDLSLASLAGAAGWCVTEIEQMLRLGRVARGVAREKDDQYYLRTAEKGWSGNAAKESRKRIESEKKINRLKDAANGNSNREAELLAISEAIGVRVTDVMRYGEIESDEPTYGITVATNFHEQSEVTINLGTTLGMLNGPSMMKSRLMDKLGAVPFVGMKAQEIHMWIIAVVRCARIVEMGDSPEDEMAEWLQEYLETLSDKLLMMQEEISGENTWLDHVEKIILRSREKNIVISGGRIYLKLSWFRTWVSATYDEKLTLKALALRVKALGWEPHQLQRGTLRSRIWISPEGWRMPESCLPGGNVVSLDDARSALIEKHGKSVFE